MNNPEPAADWPAAEEIDLRQYLIILQRRRRLILTWAFAILAGTALVTIAQTPSYRASTTLQIEPDMPKILDFQEMFQVDATNDAFYQTQYRLIESRALAARVIDQEALMADPEFADESGLAGRALGLLLGIPGQAILLLRELTGTGAAGIEEAASATDRIRTRAIDGFLRRMSVTPIRSTRLATVSWESPSPQQAARVARTIAQTYIDMNLEAKFETTQNAARFLAGEIESLQRTISENEAQLARYGSERNILGQDDRRDVTTQSLTELNRQHTTARTDRVQRQSIYESLQNAAPSSIPEVRGNRVVQDLRADLAEVQQRFAELSRRFKDGYPEYDRTRAQMEDLQGRIADEERSVYDAILRQARADYQAAQSNEQRFEQLLNQQTALVAQQDQDLIRYRSLQAQITSQRETLASLLERQSETGVSARLQGLQTSNIRIVDEAAVPLAPSSPNHRLNLLLGTIVGLMLGVGLAFTLEYLDNTLKTPEDVERHLHLPSIGVIPDLGSASASTKGHGSAYAYGHNDYTHGVNETSRIETITHDQPRSSLSESYRALRTSVLLSRAGQPPQVIAVTSAQPGEGKTTSTINLAIALAQTGKRTLLIDADLRKPRVHTVLGLSEDSGLTTLLTGSETLEDVVRETPIENLWALPSGPRPPNPAELLGSDVVKQLLRRLREHFDMIVIDTPPVSAVVDPLEMAAVADGVVLVVRAGFTPHQVAGRAARRLADVQSHIFGVALNAVNLTDSGYYGGYAQAYRYDRRERRRANEVAAG